RRFEPDNDALFTWWAPWRKMRERNMGWRLDYVLVSEALAVRSTRCSAVREFGTSDHGPVAATFDVPSFQSREPSVSPPPPASAASTPKPEAAGQLTL